MFNNKNLLMLMVALTAGIAGYFASQQFYQQDSLQFESLLPYQDNKTFSGFELVDKNDKKITIENFAGDWTLLFFGFTHCPDVCPTTLTELQRAFKIFNNKPLKSTPKVLFVSIDPERDNPKGLKEYINFFNPDFNAATADAANILSIATQVGVAYHIGDHKEGNLNYSVDHTAAVFLVSPEKKLYGIFRTPHEASKIAHDLTAIIGEK